MGGDCEAKKLELRDGELALGEADGEAMKSADVKDGSEVFNMAVEVRGENEDVINIDKGVREATHYNIHHPLESLTSIP